MSPPPASPIVMHQIGGGHRHRRGDLAESGDEGLGAGEDGDSDGMCACAFCPNKGVREGRRNLSDGMVFSAPMVE